MRQVFKVLVLLFFLSNAWIVTSCNTKGSLPNTTSRVEKESTEDSLLIISDLSATTALINNEIPSNVEEISTLLSLNPSAPSVDSLKWYASIVLHPEIIQNEQELLFIFHMRERMMDAIDKEFLSPYLSDNETEQIPETVVNELLALGIGITSAEGMYFGLNKSSLLPKKFSEVASEAFQLYNVFMTNYALSLGHEYTYLDLDPEIEMIASAEQFLNKYSQHKWAKEIDSLLYVAIYPLADMHLCKVSGERNSDYCVVGGLITDPYPSSANKTSLSDFYTKYPSSKYSEMFRKIYQNMSEIEMTADGKSRNVYIVQIEESKDTKELESKCEQYIRSGIDIPHLIAFDGLENFALVYRFYSSKEKAKNALNLIKSRFPMAKIRELRPSSETLEWIPIS